MASLVLKNLNKKYENGTKAVFDCNLSIRDKELIVIVGPEGCGKTTVLRMIAGLEDVEEGDIFLGGKSVKDVSPKDRDIAMLSQSNFLNPNLSVYDNLAFGLKLRKASAEEIDGKVKAVAALFGLTESLSKKPKSLTASQKQRVMIGRAVAREPKLFLFDEPLSNLDSKLRMQMRSEIVKLHARIASTFVYATRDQIEAMTLGTRLVVMKDGFIQQIDTPQNLYDYPVNLFVAEYFGLPRMNVFYGATLFSEEGRVYASFLGGEKILLPNTLVARVKNAEEYIDTGKRLILGIRPEDIHEDQRFLSASPETVVKVKVDIVEKLGSESRVHAIPLSLEDCPSPDPIVAKVDSRSALERGEIAELAFDAKHIYLFDEDERNLLKRDEFYHSVPENAEGESFVPLTPNEMISKRQPEKKAKKK